MDLTTWDLKEPVKNLSDTANSLIGFNTKRLDYLI